MKKFLFEHVWPRSIAKQTASELRLFDDREFVKLRRAVKKRSIKSGGQRFGSVKSRELEIKRRTDKRKHYSKAILLARPKDNMILDALSANRLAIWRKFNRRKKGVSIKCERFSFIDEPISTLETLMRIAVADCEAIDYKINFEDEHILDVGPFLVFGVMREGMAPMSRGGTVYGPARKVLEAVGLREFLRMKPFGRLRMDDVWPLPLMQRRRGGTSNSRKIAAQPTTLEIRADQITQKVDDWLGELGQPKQLSDYGRGRLKSIVTETLNNAERHGRDGGDGEWIVAGFMSRQPSQLPAPAGNYVHVCHISFLNLGHSIAQTIAGGPDATVEQIGRYCERHKRAGRRASTLATVFALQDGVSRLSQDDTQSSGGTGLMDMVEFANNMGTSATPELQPRVAIVSGNSYVGFRAPYHEGFGTAEDDRRLQWFNERNVVTEPPDGRFVMDLPIHFPGTLITMRFVIDDSLEAVEKRDGSPQN